MERLLAAYICCKEAFDMCDRFDITIGDQVIGQATAERKGLYYHFSCSCSLSGEVIYRVIVSCGDKEESLGVCIPGDGGFGLNTRIPVKRLGDGELTFRAVPKHADLKGRFIPLSPVEPFAYIDKLCKASLAVRGSTVGIILEEDTL